MTKTMLQFWILLVLLFSNDAFAVVDPKISWETMATPHFEIIFDARHYQTARKYALRLEFNYKLLSSYFQEAPQKTIVIINDSTDLANGYATHIPYPHMMIYPVLPSAHESISEYADWPQELTLHEYTHILNFQPAHGFMGFLRSTMGSIISPTMLLPRWWHEGMAVEMETRFSSHGRLRSIYQEATLRALADKNQLLNYSIADINESDLDSWPRGARPYLFGSLLFSEIQSIRGGTISNTLLQRYSSRLPYVINPPIKDELGSDFEGLLKLALSNVSLKIEKQLDQIKQEKITELTPVDEAFLESHDPRISPNGRFITFIAKNKWGRSSIQIYDRHEDVRPFDPKKDSFSQFISIDNKSDSSDKDSPPSGNINRIAWLPDSTGFIFDQVRLIDPYSNYSDLFLFDLNKQKSQRLTTGLRLREPDLSVDGTLIAAIQLEQSDTRLVTLGRQGDNLKIVYTPESFHKISNPLFINSEDLLFTERNSQGQVSLKKLSLLTQKIEVLPIKNLSQPDSLNWTSLGILFVARENGLQNVYITKDLFKTTQRLTHTKTAAFDGVLDPRLALLYSTQMSSRGLLVTQNKFNIGTESNPPSAIEPLFKDRYSKVSESSVPSSEQFQSNSNIFLEKEFGSTIEGKKEYSSLNYLRPRYWLPFAFFSGTGYGTQISTSTNDPLEKHTYSLQAGYDSFVNESSIGITYVNATSRWPFSLGFAAQERNQPGLRFQYSAKQFNYMTYRDLRPTNDNITVGFGFNGRETSTTSTVNRFGPQFVFQYDGSAKTAFSAVPFAGWNAAIFGNHYFKTQKLSNLTRGILGATYFYSEHLPDRQVAIAHVIAQQMSGERRTEDLAPSDNFQLSQDFTSPRFVLRGYNLGYFYFWHARNMTLEYHIPFALQRGWGTMPAFLKRTKISLFSDFLAAEGYVTDYVNAKYQRTYLNKIYSSYGIELKGDLTLGYYFPVTAFFGIYQRPDYSGPDKTSSFIGIQI